MRLYSNQERVWTCLLKLLVPFFQPQSTNVAPSHLDCEVDLLPLGAIVYPHKSGFDGGGCMCAYFTVQVRGGIGNVHCLY